MPWSSVAQFSPEDESSLSRHNEDDQENRCFVRDRVPGSLHPEIHVDARAGEPERKEQDGCRRCPGSAAEDAAGEGTKPEHNQPEGDHEDCVQGRLLCLTNVEALDLARCSEFEAKVSHPGRTRKAPNNTRAAHRIDTGAQTFRQIRTQRTPYEAAASHVNGTHDRGQLCRSGSPGSREQWVPARLLSAADPSSSAQGPLESSARWMRPMSRGRAGLPIRLEPLIAAAPWRSCFASTARSTGFAWTHARRCSTACARPSPSPARKRAATTDSAALAPCT